MREIIYCFLSNGIISKTISKEIWQNWIDACLCNNVSYAVWKETSIYDDVEIHNLS